MENQVPPSNQPIPGTISPEQLAEMKARARELAIQQAQVQALQQTQQRPPQVVYLRRNLTIAEVLVMLAIACGLVTGGQLLWQGLSNVLPRIEVRVK